MWLGRRKFITLTCNHPALQPKVGFCEVYRTRFLCAVSSTDSVSFNYMIPCVALHKEDFLLVFHMHFSYNLIQRTYSYLINKCQWRFAKSSTDLMFKTITSTCVQQKSVIFHISFSGTLELYL